jgi:hypothetical protein
MIQVPENAAPGSRYFVDVGQRNSRRELTGGVRLQINVLD